MLARLRNKLLRAVVANNRSSPAQGLAISSSLGMLRTPEGEWNDNDDPQTQQPVKYASSVSLTSSTSASLIFRVRFRSTCPKSIPSVSPSTVAAEPHSEARVAPLMMSASMFMVALLYSTPERVLSDNRLQDVSYRGPQTSLW